MNIVFFIEKLISSDAQKIPQVTQSHTESTTKDNMMVFIVPTATADTVLEDVKSKI